MFMTCYQPNDYFRCSETLKEVEPAPQTTTRSHWNLPKNKFAFAFFCRNGRISSCLMRTFVEIAKGAPDSVFWLRKASQFAVIRIKFCFQKAGIAGDRLIFACDVPGPVHRERIKNADLALDSRFYCGHTTASDALLAGLPYAALVGEYFQQRVSFSLVTKMLGDTAKELICSSLEELRDKAIDFATGGGAMLKEIRAVLESNVKSRLGICDGDSWVREFEWGLKEYVDIRKVNPTGKLPDVFLHAPMNTPATCRKYVLLPQERGPKADRAKTTEVPCGGEACSGQDGAAPKSAGKRSMNNSDIAEAKRRNNGSGPKLVEFQDSADKPQPEPEDEASSGPNAKARRLRIDWLFNLAENDPHEARFRAFEYLQQTLPPGRKILFVWDEDKKMKIPAIQVPCIAYRIRHDTGKARKQGRELPLCYVSEPVPGSEDRGSALYCGQLFEKGMHMTAYDGELVDSDNVDTYEKKIHVISVSFSLKQAIDSGLTADAVLVKNASLGSKANHVYRDQNVRYVRNYFERSPIAGCNQVIFLDSTADGGPHTELVGNYTSGAAERDHRIPRYTVEEGKDNIAVSEREKTSHLVIDAMQVLRKKTGVDLLKIRGEGSDGAVVEVQCGGSKPFVVKISNRQFDETKRLGGLSEAALMHQMTRHADSNIVCMNLNNELGWSTALLKASGQYVAAVAMDCADTDAHEVWAEFRKRFKNPVDAELLPDMRSVSKGTIQVAGWMHGLGLAHGDLKPANILLKRLDSIPVDPHVAFCVVKAITYQIVFGDFGHARWSGQGMNATHVFTEHKHGGKKHSLPLDFPAGKCLNNDQDSIVVVKTSVCSGVFGHRGRVEHILEHPGAGIVMIRAPEYNRIFRAGQGADQRRFDQSADMWAVGIMGLRIIAPVQGQGQQHDRDQEWADGIRKASESAHKQMTLDAHESRQSSRRSLLMIRVLQDARDKRSWIAKMVREKYPSDSWPLLDARMSGQETSAWISLLGLLEGLLQYNSELRLTADRALNHSFFSAPDTARN